MPPQPGRLGAVSPQLGGAAGAVAGLAGAALLKSVDALGAFNKAAASVGEAVGRVLAPLKVLTDALAPLGRAMLAVADAVVKPFQKLLGAVRVALEPITSYATSVFGGLAKAAGAVGQAFLAATAALAGVIGVIAGVGSVINTFVQKASPAAAQQFNLALDDMLAVLGQALTPVLNVFTGLLRTFGDAMTTLVPIGAAVAEALKPLADVLGELLAQSLANLAGVMRAVMPVVIALARVFSDVIRFVSDGVKQLLALIGVDLPEVAPKGAAVGTAARGASIGSVESVIAKAQQSAFQIGLGGEDPAKQTAGHAADIKRRADEIYNWITGELPKLVKALPGEIWEFLKTLPDLIAKAIKAGAQVAAPAVAAAGGGLPPGPIQTQIVAGAALLRWLGSKL